MGLQRADDVGCKRCRRDRYRYHYAAMHAPSVSLHADATARYVRVSPYMHQLQHAPLVPCRMPLWCPAGCPSGAPLVPCRMPLWCPVGCPSGALHDVHLVPLWCPAGCPSGALQDLLEPRLEQLAEKTQEAEAPCLVHCPALPYPLPLVPMALPVSPPTILIIVQWCCDGTVLHAGAMMVLRWCCNSSVHTSMLLRWCYDGCSCDCVVMAVMMLWCAPPVACTSMLMLWCCSSPLPPPPPCVRWVPCG